MPPVPDLAGYIDAQKRKRAALGSEVIFHFPRTLNFPVGTVLDPLTQEPYDPLIAPESESGRGQETMILSVAFKPVLGRTGNADTADSQIGEVKQNHAICWVTIDEWKVEATPDGNFPLGEPAPISFDYAGDNYLIRKTTEESLGKDPWRVLIWGERQDGAVD